MKKKVVEKSVETKGPGVISSILEIIRTKGPVTKEAILDELCKRFPDRKKESMNKTIQAQIGGKKSPTRMEKEKKIKFVIKDDKYSLSPAKK